MFMIEIGFVRNNYNNYFCYLILDFALIYFLIYAEDMLIISSSRSKI